MWLWIKATIMFVQYQTHRKLVQTQLDPVNFKEKKKNPRDVLVELKAEVFLHTDQSKVNGLKKKFKFGANELGKHLQPGG